MGCWIKGPYSLDASQKVSYLITNAAATPAISIDQNADTGSGNTSAGIYVENTGNADCAMSLFSARGAANRGLLTIGTTNAAFDQTLINLAQGGSGKGIKIACVGNGADIFLTPRASAGMAAGSEGDIYFNVTTHKLMIRGAAGWETVNSA